MKTGVSYVLSALILTLITFAVGGGMYYWYTSVQLGQQGTAEQSQEQLIGALGSCISVIGIDYDTLTNQSDVIFKNCGNSNLDIGDTKIKDIGVLRAPSIDPCSFGLNETTCVGCPFTLKPRSSRLAVINWSMERTCASRITKGIKHQIVFYIDRLSTTSSVFTPHDVVSTFSRVATATNPSSTTSICGVSITNSSSFDSVKVTYTAQKKSSTCFNVTITNTGNIVDTFYLSASGTIQNATTAPPGGTYSCSGTATDPSKGFKSCDTVNAPTSAISLSAGASQLISFNASDDLAAPAGSNMVCNFTFTVQSASCVSIYSTTGVAQLRTA